MYYSEDGSWYKTTAVGDNCYNFYESYGEICVGCGCCSSNILTQTKARLELHKRILKDRKNFNAWDYDHPGMIAVQKENIEKDIEYHKKMVEKYRRRLKRIKQSRV